ncbi:microtubule-associated protein CRIPT-domain-containing protein [Lasiosphaeria hispida]|uniref:Cysteine-rich PDZ-binding protein n=1 Tax=Lasiosphaeria hispida TaxID=260671 RepID=A0AAJ0MG37_9PEZI|nr:microtubule-associated protein CRIPT-domain-containing protein [Lasiosphaeria hispida]
MVCSKCQKLNKTTLATPGVKKKSEMYFGSTASASTSATGGTKSATLGQTGISKSKLLSKAAQNPYAQYSSSCTRCKTKVAQGHAFCHKCAYKADSCAVCGKANKKKSEVPVVNGQKFTLK